MPAFDVIVVGASGGAGSAAAFHCARRGARVLGLDRYPPGHDRASSHGITRVIRLAYFEHPDYVPLLRRAYELWRELVSVSNKPVLHEIGVAQVGPPDGEVVRGVLESARLHDLPVEALGREDAMQRFPGLRIPEGLMVAYEPQGGFLDVEACVIAHAAGARAAGAEMRVAEEVLEWRTVGDAVEVRTNRGTYDAAKLVLAPGAWAGDLLPGLGVGFYTLRKSTWWYEAPLFEHSAEGGCPAYLYDLPEGVFYGTPRVGKSAFKVAEHSGGRRVADPLADDGSLDPEERARADAFVARCLPGVGPRLMFYAICFYPMSPDDHFIVGRHPEHEQVCFAAGLSGHGFKFTSVMGEILADLALDGATRAPIDFLSWNRPGLHS